MADGHAPVYVGPYTGEIGHELLCWIPYLKSKFGDDLKSYTAISRGGTEYWYPCSVLNAYEKIPIDIYRELFERRKKSTGLYKNFHLEDRLDTRILAAYGTKRHPAESICRPREMWLTRPSQLRGFKYELMDKPPRWPGLPDEYIATRFHYNEWVEGLPDSHLKFRADVPVVNLTLRTQADNHLELGSSGDIEVTYDPIDSLSVITRVVAHAREFYCSYGSMTAIGILNGVPTIALTTKDKMDWYADLAFEVAGNLNVSLTVKNVQVL